MAKYHVGIGIITNTIYAGTLTKDKSLWKKRSDVTEEAIEAVARYFINTETAMSFSYNGKRYRISVEEVSK